MFLLLVLLGCGGRSACDELVPGDELALDDVCVDGLCAEILFADAVTTWGAPVCEEQPEQLACAFDPGVIVWFDDFDGDGNVDSPDDHDVFDQEIRVEAPYDGASADGLTVGTPLSCFEGVYGAPTETGTSTDGVRTASWWVPGPLTEPTRVRVGLDDDDRAIRIDLLWSWSE